MGGNIGVVLTLQLIKVAEQLECDCMCTELITMLGATSQCANLAVRLSQGSETAGFMLHLQKKQDP